MLHGNAPALSEAFVNENFDFFRRTLFGAQELEPRWRRCVRATDRNLGEVLGQVYVARAFPRSSKQRVLQLVQDLQRVLAQDIEEATWMSPATKKQAQEKLRATLNKIGYPDKWRGFFSGPVGPPWFLLCPQHATPLDRKSSPLNFRPSRIPHASLWLQKQKQTGAARG